MKIKNQNILILCEEKADKCEDCWCWHEYLQEVEKSEYQTEEVDDFLDILTMSKHRCELKEGCLFGCKKDNCPILSVEKEKIEEIEKLCQKK